MIKLKIGLQNQELIFLVDSGAEQRTVQWLPPECAKSKDTMVVIGAKGEPFKIPVIKDVEIESETRLCLGNILLVEEADYNLLGRGFMVALEISLIVQESQFRVNLYRLITEDEDKMDPKVWHTQGEAEG